MITLVFMTDPQRVVGGSTKLRNLARMPFLPMSELPKAMDEIMAGKHMVIGSGSAGFYAGNAKKYDNSWLLTRKKAPGQLASGLKVCNELQGLVKRYKDSDDELLVLGGLSVWTAFLPYADRIRTAETYKNVPGDLVFDAWDQGDFVLVKEHRRKKLAVREYQRRTNMAEPGTQ
jgi:dihydrofolate reductase